jgi:hypothetical protein
MRRILFFSYLHTKINNQSVGLKVQNESYDMLIDLERS